MEAAVLCSGSKGNCTLVRTAGMTVLIDVGMSTKRYLVDSLAQFGCTIDDIDAVLVTHSHSDHVKQLKAVLGKPVYSWCPLDPGKCPAKGPAFQHYEILPWRTYTFKDLTVQTIALSHDSGKTLGFILLADGEKLVYITDTGFVRQDAEPLLQNADYYILESNHDPMMLEQTRRPRVIKQRILSAQGHLDNEYASRLLCRLLGKRTRKIVLAHLSEEANTPELALETLQEIMEENHLDPAAFQIKTAEQYEPLVVAGFETHAPDNPAEDSSAPGAKPVRVPEPAQTAAPQRLN